MGSRKVGSPERLSIETRKGKTADSALKETVEPGRTGPVAVAPKRSLTCAHARGATYRYYGER